jgi:hypothetical protein
MPNFIAATIPTLTSNPNRVIPGRRHRVRPLAGPMAGSEASPESITTGRGLWIPGVTGAKLVAAPLGHGRARPGNPDNRALCHPGRDRRDKPGDDATSFAPVTSVLAGKSPRPGMTDAKALRSDHYAG